MTQDEFPLPEFKRISLDKIQINVSRIVSDTLFDITLESHRHHLFNGMAYVLRGYVWGEKLKPQTIRYPLDWWQALKERWCPKRVLVRWPVLYAVHSITAAALYPDFRRAMPTERCVMDIFVTEEHE